MQGMNPQADSAPSSPASVTSLTHHDVVVDGLGYHLVTAGSGPTVVLVTGFPQSWYAWRRVIPLLSDRYRVIAVDLPGQGDSAIPVDGYDTATTARRLRSLLSALGERRYVLVGHDIGAWTGYPYAHLFPEELRGAVLIDASVPGVTPPVLTIGPESWRSWHFLFNTIPDLPEALWAGRERVLLEWFFRSKSVNFSRTFTEADLDEYQRVYGRPGGLSGVLGYYRAYHVDSEQNTALHGRRIRVPLLALGAASGIGSLLYERLLPLGEDVRGGVIGDSGHYIPEEQPEALAAALESFIATLAP